MAKKSEKSNAAFRKLKEDLETGSLGNAYIFHGEESYLREVGGNIFAHSTDELRDILFK